MWGTYHSQGSVLILRFKCQVSILQFGARIFERGVHLIYTFLIGRHKHRGVNDPIYRRWLVTCPIYDKTASCEEKVEDHIRTAEV